MSKISSTGILGDLKTLIANAEGRENGVVAAPENFGKNVDRLTTMPTSFLSPNKNQPREYFDDVSLNELANSIQSQGIVQPITVRLVDTNNYEIITGERRWRAAQKIGLPEVPVIIKDIPDESVLAISVIENIQREDLNPVEEAKAFQKLRDEFNLTHEKIADLVGKSRATVSNTMRLLGLSLQVQIMLVKKELDMGHARALLSLDEEQQISLAAKIVRENLTVREVEKLIQGLNNKASEKQPVEIPIFNADIGQWRKLLENKLHTQVNIKLNNRGEGRVTIKVSSVEELEWIINHIDNT